MGREIKIYDKINYLPKLIRRNETVLADKGKNLKVAAARKKKTQKKKLHSSLGRRRSREKEEQQKGDKPGETQRWVPIQQLGGVRMRNGRPPPERQEKAQFRIGEETDPKGLKMER